MALATAANMRKVDAHYALVEALTLGKASICQRDVLHFAKDVAKTIQGDRRLRERFIAGLEKINVSKIEQTNVSSSANASD